MPALNWYAGPWVWDASLMGGCWRAPSGLQGLDMRTLPEMSAQGGTPGNGLFCGTVERADLESRADYAHLGSGSWYDLKPSSALKARIPRRKGYQPKGDDLVGLVLDVLTDGADPDGGDGPMPIVPTAEGRVELHFGMKHAERFAWGKGHFSLVRDGLRKQFAGLWQRSPRLARKCLDYWCEKYGVDDWADLVPAALRADVPGRLPHETTITESFTRADSTSVMGNDLSWTQVAGSWGTSSNKGYKVATNGVTQAARADSDLSSADHYVQCVIANGTNATGHGPACRFSSSANTYYTTLNFTNLQYLIKIVSGSQTNLTSTSHTYANGETLKVEINGSSLNGYANGTQYPSTTDTSITGNTRGGVVSYGINGTVDDFQAADLAASGIVYTQLERGLRGMLRGLWTGRGV